MFSVKKKKKKIGLKINVIYILLEITSVSEV